MSRLTHQVCAVVCLHFVLWTVGAFLASAQEFRGSLLVVIQDSTAARIPGAVVSLTQSKLGVTRTAKTDTRGETRFEALQSGMYTVAVTAAGFTKRTSSVTVTVGSQPTLAITLNPETIQETVQVHDRGPSLATQPIEATSTIKIPATISFL